MSIYTEITTGPLAVELGPSVINHDFSTIANALNRKDIEVYGKLTVHDVKQYISLLGLRLPMLDSTTLSCREFNMALADFTESGFDLSNPIILGKITATLDAVVAEPLIPDFTETNKLTILSFGKKMISRAEQLGLAINENDISNAIHEVL
jgi:hypothetical protein